MLFISSVIHYQVLYRGLTIKLICWSSQTPKMGNPELIQLKAQINLRRGFFKNSRSFLLQLPFNFGRTTYVQIKRSETATIVKKIHCCNTKNATNYCLVLHSQRSPEKKTSCMGAKMWSLREVTDHCLERA